MSRLWRNVSGGPGERRCRMSADADGPDLLELAQDEPRAVRQVAERAGEDGCEELREWLLEILGEERGVDE